MLGILKDKKPDAKGKAEEAIDPNKKLSREEAAKLKKDEEPELMDVIVQLEL